MLRPELAFQAGNPLLLTTIGEFVVKNLVLLAAGLVSWQYRAARHVRQSRKGRRRPWVAPPPCRRKRHVTSGSALRYDVE